MPERMSLSVHGVVVGAPAVVRTRAPSLVMTLESSSLHASFRDQETALDKSGCLLLPERETVTLRGDGPAARVAILGFAPSLLDVVCDAYAKLGVQRARLARWLSRPELLPRTVWVHEIAHRYVFERYALGEHDNDATRFLEVEILKEIYFLFRDREAGVDRASIVRAYSRAVERALAYVEAHLFDPVSIPALVKRSGASESTLLRSFRRELGCTPGAFWRARKLDEALVLVRGGRHSVAEIAQEIGYDNPTAFGHAFRQRFGRPPSAFRPQTPVRRAP